MKTIVFDTETSGLIGNRIVNSEHLPEIIEFYGCLVDLSNDDEPEQELHFLAKPSHKISPQIEKITSITNEMLENEAPFSANAERVRDFLQCEDVLAHNCSFDKEMVEIELQRNGFNIQWGRCICTVEQTIHLTGKRLSQSALHEHLFGVKFKDAHRAKPDVKALVRCARKLYREGQLE